MTHITIYKSSATNRTVGFKSAGHAGYAEEGSDIICSAISVLTINTINSIEQFTDALELGLRTMAADNPDYLLITVKEV